MRTVRVDPAKKTAVLTALHTLTFPSDEIPTWKHDATWLVMDNGEPVAFLYAEDVGDNTLYFSRVGVLPSHRGKGVQAKLMAKLEAHAKAEGYEVIISTTLNNLPSANSFIKRGWRLYDPAAPWAWEGTLYWRHQL